MVHQLDPTVPRVWRSPRALQFGVERPLLILDPVGVAEERMISALAAGATLGALRMIARGAGAGPAAVDVLLARLKPVLESSPDAEPGDAPVVVLDGTGPTAARILALLREAGVDVRSGLAADDPAVDLATAAVVVGAFAIAPHRHQRWLRRDIPHLAVVFGDGGVTVGPFVRPGEGACLRCVDLHRRDADPAWPALAAQLHTRPLPGETELICGAAASAAAGAVVALLRGAPERSDAASRYDAATARWSERRWEPHPECGCLSPLAAPPSAPAPARPGTARLCATPAAPAGFPAAPSSAAAGAVRA
ncbi:TOMM precursor leader peptide-binding protein [Leifsonia sp. L25]|uniref:TOMM precursor leader peptide-binding protein n=1 Tax=Actinomycetes TaxID=1760 RepID=UPI003D691C4B